MTGIIRSRRITEGPTSRSSTSVSASGPFAAARTWKPRSLSVSLEIPGYPDRRRRRGWALRQLRFAFAVVARRASCRKASDYAGPLSWGMCTRTHAVYPSPCDSGCGRPSRMSGRATAEHLSGSTPSEPVVTGKPPRGGKEQCIVVSQLRPSRHGRAGTDRSWRQVPVSRRTFPRRLRNRRTLPAPSRGRPRRSGWCTRTFGSQ